MNEQEQAVQPDAELDLRGVICPYNFVKTKLKLETMEQGQILSVILDAGDPIRNVPMSVSNEGHEVLSQEPLHHPIASSSGAVEQSSIFPPRPRAPA